MHTSLETIAEFMQARGFKFGLNPLLDFIHTGFNTPSYRTPEGDASLQLIIRIDEGGEFLSFIAPNVYKCAVDHPHRDALLRACAEVQWRVKMLRFAYDSADGEIRAEIHVPLEDNPLTARQFHRALGAIIQLVDEFHPVLTTALESGMVDFQTADANRRRGGDLAAGLAEMASRLLATIGMGGGGKTKQSAAAELTLAE